MLNLDWFNPFDRSQYSTGAIYGVICNLPREERFKPCNMIIMALLPGPNEAKLHSINNYLAPIVNQLLELWKGVQLITRERPEGIKIRCALIACSCDIPAARKLCSHISYLVAYHRCKKKANYDPITKRSNFGEFKDMKNWFLERDVKEYRTNAVKWLSCKTQEARKRHVSEHLVR